MKKAQEIKGEVISIGRKWIKIVLDGGNKKYPQNLLINEITKSLKVGEKFQLYVETTSELTYRGCTKYTHIAIEENAAKDIEILRWWGYIEQTYQVKGYVYTKGVERLHELNCHEYDSEIIEMRKLCEKKSAIENIRRIYIKEKRIYKKGIESLKKLGCTEYDSEIIEMQESINKQPPAKNEIPKEANRKIIGYGCDYYSRPIIGGIIVTNNDAWKIEKVSKESDGMSFGYMSEWWWCCKCINVTETAIGKEAIEKEKKQIEKRKFDQDFVIPAKEKVKEAREMLQEAIKSEDTLLANIVSIPEAKETLFDNMNSYGGGSAILISTSDEIWYIINNGSDGADWSYNHISTGGAGAYGYACPVSKIVDIINRFKSVSADYELICNQYENK